jgi:hypothetical protein
MNSLIPLQKIGTHVIGWVSNSTSPHDEMEDKAATLIHAQFFGVRVRVKTSFLFFQDLYFYALNEIRLGLVLVWFSHGFEPGHEGYSHFCPVPSSFSSSHMPSLPNCGATNRLSLAVLYPSSSLYILIPQSAAARISIRYPASRQATHSTLYPVMTLWYVSFFG